MTWEQIKQTYPVGSIDRWTVRSVHPYGVFMETTSAEVKVLLSVTDLSDAATYPPSYPAVGEVLRCVVIGHSPLDKRVRLSARAYELIRWEQPPSENNHGPSPEHKQ